MAFNHYAKIKRIIDQEPPGWYIKQINEPTQAKNFKGEIVHFDHYYRIFNANNQPIKYCKFQQLSRLAHALRIEAGELPITSEK